MKRFFKYQVRRQLSVAAAAGAMIIGLYSCKKDITERELISNYEMTSYSELFTAFWKGMNTKYVFWDQETTNWDNMYRVYKPKFDSLDLRTYSDTTDNICFQYLADMTKNLKDGQYALNFWSGGDYRFEDSLFKGYISFIPKLQRTQWIRPALPDTLFDYIVQYNYLRDFDYGIYRNSNTNDIFQVITGRLSKGRKNVLYTSLNTFMMKEAYNSANANRPPRPVIKNFFDNIHKSNCDAVIIDLRNNRGGNLEDVNFLVGQFISKPLLFGYARFKNGAGRLDYSPSLPLTINPEAGTSDFNKPIVILADIYSAALCETVITAFKGLTGTKVTVIGERTYGSSGMFSGDDISTNAGSFQMGRMASARLSNTALMDKNHQFNFNGIAPDFEIRYNAASISQMLHSGVDIQMEKAIQFLNQ